AAPGTRARLRGVSSGGRRLCGAVTQHLGGGVRGPPPGGRCGLGRAGAGPQGSARFRPARAPGGPGWVLSVPSAFRKGDSATRSRVEKLCKTKNE
ncbi:unnamed protein product, partial [Gulo gulo]